MKKIIAITMSLCMFVLLFATSCGGNTTEDVSSTENGVSSEVASENSTADTSSAESVENNETSSESPSETSSETTSNGGTQPSNVVINAPSVLADGTYRLVPSVNQLTEAGRVHFSSTKELTYWSTGASSSAKITLDSSGNEKRFVKLITSLGFSCSFVVKDGKVSDVILRPSTVAQKPITDNSSMTYADYGKIKLSLEIATKQSKLAGGITPGGTTVILSSSIPSIALNLDGVMVADKGNTAGFVTMSSGVATFDTDAAVNATAKIGVKTADGYRTFTFTKTSADKITVVYNDADTLNQ